MKIIVVVTLILVLAGCAGSYQQEISPLAGSWLADSPLGSVSLVQLNPSGTATMYLRVGNPWKVKWSGYWRLDNTNILLLDKRGKHEYTLNIMGRGVLYMCGPMLSNEVFWFHRYQGATP